MTDSEIGRKSQVGEIDEPIRGRPRSEAADTAIARATLTLLSTEGLEGTTMAAIARLAGVSTATLYRRYANRTDAVIDALGTGAEAHEVLDTGSFRSDLDAFVSNLIQNLADEHGARIIRALLDEAQRDPALADAVETNMAAPARRGFAYIVERAQERGEISKELSLEVLIDFGLGPIYHRWFQALRPLDDAFREGIVSLIAAAVQSGPSRNERQDDIPKN